MAEQGNLSSLLLLSETHVSNIISHMRPGSSSCDVLLDRSLFLPALQHAY